MQMLTAPTNINYTATCTTTQNICTGWPATGYAFVIPRLCGPVLFRKWRCEVRLQPNFYPGAGRNLYIYPSDQDPAGRANGLVDCNTVGFIAKSQTGGYNINPVESVPVCRGSGNTRSAAGRLLQRPAEENSNHTKREQRCTYGERDTYSQAEQTRKGYGIAGEL